MTLIIFGKSEHQSSAHAKCECDSLCYLIWLFILLMCVVSGGSFYQAINFVCTIRVFNKLHSECSDHISMCLA